MRAILEALERVSEKSVIGDLLKFAELERPWSPYLGYDDSVAVLRAAKNLQLYVGSYFKPMVGDEIVAYRATNRKGEYGDLKSGKEITSKDHASGRMESGLSVSDGLHYAARGYKYVYKVKGKVVGFGEDGEPVLVGAVPVGRLMNSVAAVNKDLESGDAAQRRDLYRELSKKTGVSIENLMRLGTMSV